jgi:hypothetical protein
MTSSTQQDWPWPGSRWWKFDFHTHTPASRDTDAWQQAIGTPDEVSPEKWLLKFMAADIDCVAVTDHNSGEWIDPLKAAYNRMKQQADGGNPPDGFRELAIFSGVEISVNGDAEMVHAFDFRGGQCHVAERGALQEKPVREEVCRIMEGGHEAFERRWARLGRDV